MLINTFWKILLKIIGLWILFSSISIIPQFFTTLSFVEGSINIIALLQVWGILLGSIVIYFIIIRIFLFKTDWIIQKLKLNQNFNEDKIDLNIKPAQVLTIVIIIMGALILIESVPMFISRIYDFLKQKTLFREYRDPSWLIFYFIKAIIGYSLFTNGKYFAKFIEKNSEE
ncbi:hypothetical protein GON26_18150 [Flavobacterium sp. GA093]|uniref:Uncharacterized protein n=1 Tax=Flavobacterium hydrocarbonoxydans TaxID=2683249 RepID=A0A6I4NPW2_9FLAO|nr:hypothetical protein [Flavobacterium hydrocarbonoxydans]MWB96290.1 hypothetical protein [Flavobacterium hydrocarbonoxydans]